MPTNIQAIIEFLHDQQLDLRHSLPSLDVG